MSEIIWEKLLPEQRVIYYLKAPDREKKIIDRLYGCKYEREEWLEERNLTGLPAEWIIQLIYADIPPIRKTWFIRYEGRTVDRTGWV